AQLLAFRIPLDRGAPGAETLRQAVERAGVLATMPAARATALPADVKSSLLQLRAGLLSLLDGGAIAPIAPVSRRPPPPLRDAPPRGLRAEPPSLADAASPREAARTLLHQTDAALSRLRLTQLASQPPDATRAAAPGPNLLVEVPMLLGGELAIAQLRVERDGSRHERGAARGWRMRFAVSFSAIGEVGAEVSLIGRTASVLIWAGEDATADALEAMLPGLPPALAARGLAVGTVRVRRGAPQPEASMATGRLMDRVR
ncbi:MAG TPA: flagellar hook-length control protein FliK, partial [Alphaproteobacteria bacterium]|nr:flagellar hook-length control protein FliK [Alphaproteobacteria bacterium]